jgi:hypothetical protein
VAARASGKAIVVLSWTTTAANRASSGSAAGSVASTCRTATVSTSLRQAAACGVNRAASPWGLIVTPRTAAV